MGRRRLESRPAYVPKPPESCDLEPKRIAVIASGAEWPYPELSQLRELAHPGSVNNIDGGLGFVAGVQTHQFPFDTCVPMTRDVACTITFSERSATLVGFVTSSCDGGPRGASVTLRGPDAGGTRSANADTLGGRFGFQGLDPGVPYSLILTYINYLDYESEPLTFGEAAVDTVSFTMVHDGPCPA
jgi:hypothetical protein